MDYFFHFLYALNKNFWFVFWSGFSFFRVDSKLFFISLTKIKVDKKMAKRRMREL